MELKIVVTDMLEENVYIYFDSKTKAGIIVDPGGNLKDILKVIEENNISVLGILITHGHYDHIACVNELRNITKAKVYANKDEKEILNDRMKNMSYKLKDYGFDSEGDELDADIYLEDNEEISFNTFKFKAIHTPGHTKGGCCYFDFENKVLFTGDTLFKERVGRIDLPTGNKKDIIYSVSNKLFSLDEDVIVYPGHMDKSTIGYEKKHNMVNGMY